MRKYIILIIGFSFIAPIHAQEGLKLYNAADTLYAKTGEKYAVRIINELSGVVTYYLESDPTKAERKVNKNQLNEIFRIRTNDRKAYQLDTAFLLGKEIYMQARPFSSSLSRFFMLSFDIGVGKGQYILTDGSGENIKFFSEMACVNYLIGQGWQLYEILNIPTGEVGGAVLLFQELALGGSVTLSTNIYYFKRKF